jgi:hypothetical protein
MAIWRRLLSFGLAAGITLLLTLHSFSAVAQRVASAPGSAARAAGSLPAPATFDCGTVTEIPQAECQALVALYNGAGGASWLHSDGWLASNTPCG